jgi:chromo domain-containing protein 1
MVDPDVEYDTDTISLTSTVESENDGMYYIKGILSEGVGEDQYGNETMKYLVEWDGYPMHQCTWEPEDGLRSEGASVLETWAKVKARMSKREFAKSIKRNESKFEEAQAQYTDSKEIRKEKRAKRRRKLRQLNRRRIDDGSEDDSTDDIPLMQRRQSRERKEKAVEPAPTYSQEIYNSLFVDSQDPDPLGPPSSLGRSDDGPSITQRPVHRKPPLEQSSENEEDSSSSEGSGDSLMGELADKAQRKTRRNPASKQAIKDINLGNSILSSKSLKQKTNDPPAKPATASATAKAQGPSQGQAQPAILQRTLTAPTNSTVANDTGVQSQQRRLSESSAQVPLRVSTIVASTAAPTTSSRATAAASTSNLVKSNTLASAQEQSGSVAAPVSRKNGTASKTSNPIRITNGPKVAQRKEWNTEGVLYDKVKFRYHAEKRSKMEGTPDITKLQFVGAGPTGTIVAKPKRSAPDDNPYGRREMRTRRVQEMDVAGTSRRDSLEEDIPVEKRYPGKVPLICARDRLSRDCPVGPDRCRFIHDDRSNLPVGDIGGYLPPKYRVPPVTCPFWLRKPHGCTKPDNECDFAHKNTGWIPSNTMNAQPIPCDPKEIPHREQIVSKILENNEMASKNAQTSIRAPLTNNGGPPGGRKHIKPTDKTCWYWANKECDKGDKCKFKHYHTGEVAKVSRTTCKFWEQGYCNKTAEQCQYLHGEPQQSGVNHGTSHSPTEDFQADIAQMRRSPTRKMGP